jgi:hypothetical protein
MNFRTTFKIDPSPWKISYKDRTMLIGSCFTSYIGAKMAAGKMDVMINPSGTVYNPVSVCNTLDMITSGREFSEGDLYCHDGMWLSFYHYTDFSSEDPAKVLEKINNSLKRAAEFIGKAGCLIITFGTARVYRWRESGTIVSNCHKIPSGRFSAELLQVADVVNLWNFQLERLSAMYPGLKVIFTISPVRHLKDGAYGNQVSKSALFLAVEELLKHRSNPQYFPAYELVVDDLRDYRFYENDMVHPSVEAINYIWDHFTGCYFEKETMGIWNSAAKITSAVSHRFNTENIRGKRIFAERMLEQISVLGNTVPSIDFAWERDYFSKLLSE